MPHEIRTQNLIPRIACRSVRGLDRLVAACAATHQAPVSVWISRLKLWHHLQSGPPQSPDGRRLLALTFDLDYQADTDALTGLVELVGRYGVRMSVVAVGRLVDLDPTPYEVAVAAGHEIVNHTWSHPDNPVLNPAREFWHLEAEEMAAEIACAQEIFERRLGVRPAGFRSPHFKDAQRMIGVLESFAEIRYTSSVLATATPTGLPYFPAAAPVAGEDSYLFSSASETGNSAVLMIPLTPCPEHRWSPLCSYHSIREPRNPSLGRGMHDLPTLASLWGRVLRECREDGFASVYFDPMDVMRDGETVVCFASMLALALDQGWTVTTLGEVEKTWRPFLGAQQSLLSSASPEVPAG